jgi:hypothetical protein
LEKNHNFLLKKITKYTDVMRNIDLTRITIFSLDISDVRWTVSPLVFEIKEVLWIRIV